ncbi:hypothetical protein, partial [Vibrio harveyi]|uniref:hypothetical protein n=1 Tax=Vibrio harveyi TaxID=669 RepID=UPI001E2A92B0
RKVYVTGINHIEYYAVKSKNSSFDFGNQIGLNGFDRVAICVLKIQSISQHYAHERSALN